MSYININISFCQQLDKNIYSNFYTPKSTFFTPNLFFRLANLNMILPRIFEIIADTFLGITSGILSFVYFRKFDYINVFATNHLQATQYSLRNLARTIQLVINPACYSSSEKSWISREGNGLVTDLFYKEIKDFAMNQSKPENNFFSRHVVSRVAFTLLGGYCIAARSIDALISIPANAASLATLGLIPFINNIAARSLQWPGIFLDSLYALDHIIAPSSSLNKNMSISESYCMPMLIKAEELRAENSTFFTPNIYFRLAMLKLILPRIFALIADAYLGFTVGVLNCLTLSQNYKIYNFAFRHLSATQLNLSNLFETVLHIINPAHDLKSKNAYVSSIGDGFVSNLFMNEIIDFATTKANAKNDFFNKHIVSRLTFTALGVYCVATRMIDGLISIPATIASFAFLGLIPSINHIARRSLEWTGVLNEGLYVIDSIINLR